MGAPLFIVDVAKDAKTASPADPAGRSAVDLSNPQSWNAYAYVLNDPTTLTDPSGLHGECSSEVSNRNGGCQGAAIPGALESNTQTGTALTNKHHSSNPVNSDQRQNTSQVDKDKFVNYMNQHAGSKSTHRCGFACRKGLAAGGLDTSGHPADAKDYGPFLTKHGASVVPNKNYKPEKGDIVVFGGNKSHPFGHVEVYNGKGWVSDFQQHSMIPYRSNVPPHTIYRFPDDE